MKIRCDKGGHEAPFSPCPFELWFALPLRSAQGLARRFPGFGVFDTLALEVVHRDEQIAADVGVADAVVAVELPLTASHRVAGELRSDAAPFWRAHIDDYVACDDAATEAHQRDLHPVEEFVRLPLLLEVHVDDLFDDILRIVRFRHEPSQERDLV